MASRFIASLLLLGIIGSSAWSRPVDLSAPSPQLGSAGQKGYLEVWKEVPGLGLQLGSSYLPFRYKFTTDPSVNGLMGAGFYMPALEAKSVLIREDTMRANLPCGKVLYFWRDAYDPNKFQTPDKEWTGTVHDQDYTVSRDDGWAINYHQGRLSSITTDDHHVFKWNYQGELPISIDRDGASVLTVQPNGTGQLGSIIQGAKSYEIGYDKRPLTEVVSGITVIKELAPAMSSFKAPDGKKDNFAFDLSQDRVPGLTVADNSGKSTSYTWNPTNSYIASEDGPGGKWTYTVGQVSQEFGVPPLSRTSSDGKTEGMSVDTKTGIYTEIGSDGVKKITKVFETPGPLYQKVKSVEEVSGGVTNTILRASYDEVGRLIRKLDVSGYIWTYTYDKNGNLNGENLAMGKEVLDRLAVREKWLMKQIDSSPAAFKQDAIFNLALFYVEELQQPEKGLALIPQLTDPGEIYNLEFEAPLYSKGMTPEKMKMAYNKLIAAYPEKKTELSRLFRQ